MGSDLKGGAIFLYHPPFFLAVLRFFSGKSQVTFESPVGDRGALVIDDSYLWTTNGDAEGFVLDGDNEVVESTGALVCSDCQVGTIDTTNANTPSCDGAPAVLGVRFVWSSGRFRISSTAREQKGIVSRMLIFQSEQHRSSSLLYLSVILLAQKMARGYMDWPCICQTCVLA